MVLCHSDLPQVCHLGPGMRLKFKQSTREMLKYAALVIMCSCPPLSAWAPELPYTLRTKIPDKRLCLLEQKAPGRSLCLQRLMDQVEFQYHVWRDWNLAGSEVNYLISD